MDSALNEAIVQGMQKKKAQDITLLDLKKIEYAVADYFIICSGSAQRQVEAIAEGVIEATYQQVGEKPWKQEGLVVKEWVLLDYGNVVVHVFHQQKRPYYMLDTLWGDAVITHIAN